MEPTAGSQGPRSWLHDAERVDVAVYAAIARTPTPALDGAMARLTRAADYSRLSLGTAALLAATGRRRGRRAAATGLASIGVTAAVVNLVFKPLGGRRRPERVAAEVPIARQTRMPISTSFPSGHSAAAFAFANGVGHVFRRPRSPCTPSPPWSRTRACTPASTIPPTWSPAPWPGPCSRS